MAINWLIASLIISSVFRSFLRGQIIDPPNWWYHTIEEVANSPSNYPIYVPSDSITYFSVKQKAKYDKNFEKLLNKIKLISVDEMFSIEKEKKFYKGKCASFATSLIHEFHKIMFPDLIVVDEIRFDHMLDVRVIRKDFQFSDKIVKL